MKNAANQAVGSRIREVRLEKGKSLEDVAAQIEQNTGEKVHFTTIAKIERSVQTISVDWLIKIGDALGVDPVVFLGAKPSARVLPVLGRIAAGNWREAIANPEGWRAVPAELKAGPNAFVLLPDGDSMDKIVDDDGFIVIDPDKAELNDGRLYAILNGDGEATFKQFRSNPMRLEPCSTNPEHQPLALGREPFTVIGQVIFAANQYV